MNTHQYRITTLSGRTLKITKGGLLEFSGHFCSIEIASCSNRKGNTVQIISNL